MTVTTSTEARLSRLASARYSSDVLDRGASSQASTASKGRSGSAASLSIS